VVFSFLPACGRCRWCATGHQNLCDLGAGLLAGARWTDPTSFRLHLDDGTPVGQMCGISTFCEYTTVAVDSTVKVPDDTPLESACLLGCSVCTGWGSAVNTGEVRPGDTVIIQGVGGIGINAVQGAAHAGAANRAGHLKLDELVTTRYDLDDVARGYEDMHAGKNIRGVIIY
jgi:S-(hydroxymethyl)glutathione dehydrogenase/alcohol dehydrogenase